MRLMFIETEATPNPATMKFLPGRTVMTDGTRDFAEPSEAENSPLASVLFEIDDVTGVFFGRDFISVSVRDATVWPVAKPIILSTLLDHFSANHPLFVSGHVPQHGAANPVVESRPEDSEIVDQILDLVETRVRPAVANDGGDIIYRGYADGIVYLQMQGACSGCPSSTATLKQGIESLLKYYVPEVEHVEAV